MRRVGAAGALLAIAGLLAGGAGGQEVLQSPYAVTPPDIDGVVGEDEWRAAARLTLASRDGGARCVFLVMNDTERLYVGVDAIHDITNTTASSPPHTGFDNMAIWFKGEVGYWLYGDGRLRTDRIDARGRRTFHFDSRARGAAMGPPAARHMMYELSVPLEEIGVALGGTVATGLHYWDNYDRGPSFWWPRNVGVFLPERYGRLAISQKP
ncbi:MAG: hypothetical protein QN168_03965 [Armatimonadota bacterium]|nr:hypothetical protein [Armatimonadota bacterium]